MKKILVTGGSGFLGSHIADRLSDAGHLVTIFDQNRSRYLRSDQNMIVGDINDSHAVDETVSGMEIVYHLAALSDLNKAKNDPVNSMQINIMGTINLLEACRKAKIERFVFASSIYVCSKTGSFYRVSKHACELLIEEYERSYGLNFTNLRFGTLYGTRADNTNSVFDYIKQARLEQKIFVHGSGQEVREYIHVYDAAEISLKMLSPDYSCKTMILTGQYRMRLKELIEMIVEILGCDVETHYGDIEEAHYVQTPYSYIPNIGTKIVSNTFQDMGQGLVEIMNEMDQNLKKNVE
jgi:UDP-glucose 4-epimerase